MAERKAAVRSQLAESVLEAAGSLFQLQEELDRISLTRSPASRRSRRRGRRNSKKERRNLPDEALMVHDGGSREAAVSSAQDAVSLGSRGSCEQSPSPYDSAIGSLHSQTDNDSLNSSLSIPHPQSLSLTPALEFSCGLSQNTPVREARVEEYFFPQAATPTIIFATEPSPAEKQSMSQSGKREKYQSSSEMVVMGTTVQLREKKTQKQRMHAPLTTEDAKRHFEWLESAERSSPVLVGAERVYQTQQNITADLESEGSCSTVVAEEQADPETVVCDKMWYEEATSESEKSSPNQSDYHSQRRRIYKAAPVHGFNSPRTQASMPQRYHMGVSQRPRMVRRPQRAPSILQRLKRRRGSFRREVEPHHRHRQVQRSLSDRFVYHLKKKWERGSGEDLCPISSPSQLRPVGRLLRTYAGRLHILQLHKPPDGHYGIYITQGVEGKIFISRFATATAQKFFAGLLSPGDELVMINKIKIRGKSLDYVYSLLSQMDSVIVGVVPVTAHRNW